MRSQILTAIKRIIEAEASPLGAPKLPRFRAE
jgi:hypothetical protein